MNKIETASGEAPADICGRNEVATHFDALGDPADGEFGRGQREVMNLDGVTQRFCPLEGAGVVVPLRVLSRPKELPVLRQPSIS